MNQQIKELVNKARIDFLNQDELTLWQFVEEVCQKSYYMGKISEQTVRLVRAEAPRRDTRVFRMNRPPKRVCKSGKCKIN